jgi:hypothetical protein
MRRGGPRAAPARHSRRIADSGSEVTVFPRRRDSSICSLGVLVQPTPDYAKVLPETGRCPLCRSSFKLTLEAAALSNKLQEENIGTKGKAV